MGAKRRRKRKKRGGEDRLAQWMRNVKAGRHPDGGGREEKKKLGCLSAARLPRPSRCLGGIKGKKKKKGEKIGACAFLVAKLKGKGRGGLGRGSLRIHKEACLRRDKLESEKRRKEGREGSLIRYASHWYGCTVQEKKKAITRAQALLADKFLVFISWLQEDEKKKGKKRLSSPRGVRQDCRVFLPRWIREKGEERKKKSWSVSNGM